MEALVAIAIIVGGGIAVLGVYKLVKMILESLGIYDCDDEDW